jgi:hypothetical protein
MVANTVKGLADTDQRIGIAATVGKPTAVGPGTHGTGGVSVGTDASVGAVGTDLDDAAGNGLTQLIVLYGDQGLLVFHFHTDIPAFLLPIEQIKLSKLHYSIFSLFWQ